MQKKHEDATVGGDLKKEPMLSIGSEHKLRSENLAYDIDVWYPLLKDFTPAIAVMNFQNTRYNSRQRLTTEDVEVLKALEQRIDEVIESPIRCRGYVLNLVTTAHFYACVDGARKMVWTTYEAELETLTKTEGYPLTANTKLIAISRVHWLRVRTGREAMSLVLSSERVFADLHDWLQWGEPEQIVLRRFNPEFCMEFEFRGFVCGNQLNALSQYDHYCQYPRLLGLKDHIQAKILAYWASVHPHVGDDRYIIDFAYLLHSDSVVVIELSPFLTCTGTALFNWTRDRHQLQNGPFEFRINSQSHPQLDLLVEANWEMRWQGHVESFDHYYSQAQPAPVPSPVGTVGSVSAYRSKDADLSSSSASLRQRRSAPAAGSHTSEDEDSEKPARRARVPGASTLTSWLLRGVTALHHVSPARLWARARNWILLPLLAALLWLLHVFAPAQLAPFSDSVMAIIITAAACAFALYRRRAQPAPQTLLFFYGTLKRGFHWNHKYLSRCRFLARAVTVRPFPLVFGECGVPYLLGDMAAGVGHPIVGEIWAIDDVSLAGLDDYEGIHKGYYLRKRLSVTPIGEYTGWRWVLHSFVDTSSVAALQMIIGSVESLDNVPRHPLEVQAYFKSESTPELRAAPFHHEYTLEYHQKNYKPIRHIRVKQELYLGEAAARSKS